MHKNHLSRAQISASAVISNKEYTLKVQAGIA